MPTNYLTQFATSGTANLPVESTWQNLTERATGFQTGLARSAYFNRLFAQGANAAYVIGQMVVDYASQDADLDGATLYSNFKTAVNSYVGGSFLPKSGGTMTGAITRSGVVLQGSSDTSYQRYTGGTVYANGAALTIWSKSHSTNAGQFELSCNDGVNSCYMRGYPDGTVKWTGGTIEFATSGTIRIAPSTYGLSLWSGDNNFDGASLQFFGRSHSSYAGRFYLRASTKSSAADTSGQSADLVGQADGHLTWGGTTKPLAVGKGERSYSNIGASGYLTTNATVLCFYLPILVAGTSVSITTLTASVRVGTGGFTTPGGSTAESLIPAGVVTQSVTMSGNFMRVLLTKSAGWGATNNTPVSVQITSLKFTVS